MSRMDTPLPASHDYTVMEKIHRDVSPFKISVVAQFAPAFRLAEKDQEFPIITKLT